MTVLMTVLPTYKSYAAHALLSSKFVAIVTIHGFDVALTWVDILCNTTSIRVSNLIILSIIPLLIIHMMVEDNIKACIATEKEEQAI